MKRHKMLSVLLCVLLTLIIVPIGFWFWPVPLPPIEAQAVAEITYPFHSNKSYHITDRGQIARIVEHFNKITVRRYLPGYQSKLSTSDIVFWDTEGQELRRLSVYYVPAGYQVFHEDEKYDPKGIQVLVQGDFLWQVRNDGLDFLFEELQALTFSNYDAVY